MPITQRRMLSLILAGNDYAQAFQAACKRVKGLRQGVTSGELSFQDAFDSIESFLNPYALQEPELSAQTLAVERAHFRQNARKNELNAARMRRLAEDKDGRPRRPLAENDPQEFHQRFRGVERDEQPLLDPSHAEALRQQREENKLNLPADEPGEDGQTVLPPGETLE